MLHKIKLPNCHPALSWIVQLQTDLLTALCAHNINQADVTMEWVAAQRPDIADEWINKFCSWVKGGKSILDHMQDIAGLPNHIKDELLTHFQENSQFVDSFDAGKNPPPTQQLQQGMSNDADKKYRAFLVLFYDPVFYKGKGYPVATNGNNDVAVRFHKNSFLKSCHTKNKNVTVCPLCDGSLDGSQVDHWLAKAHFPELSCQPYNLIEICQACNSRSNKGEKLVLDNGNGRPFDDWFHPYLRPAVDEFTIRIQQKGIIEFQFATDRQKKRMENFDALINLQSRWTLEYRTQIKRIQSKIRGKKKKVNLTKDSLRHILEDWRDDAEHEIGLKPNAILEKCVLSLAVDTESYLFEEFIVYATSD